MGYQVVEGYARFAPKCDAKSDCWQVSLRDAMTKCQKNVWHVTVCLSICPSICLCLCLPVPSVPPVAVCYCPVSVLASLSHISHARADAAFRFHIAALCALLLNTDKHTNIPTFIYAYRGLFFYIYIYIGNDMWMRQPQNLTRFCLPCKRCWVPASLSLSLPLLRFVAVVLNRFRSASCHLPVARCIISFINCARLGLNGWIQI